MHDEKKLAILSIIWIAIAYSSIIIYASFGTFWTFNYLIFDTIVQGIIIYYDHRLSQAEKRIKKLERHFKDLSAEYADYVSNHGNVVEITSYMDGKPYKQAKIS